MDVGAWLKSLGLEQYEAALRENDVDAEVLPTLTAEELKDIGVSSIRHRRRLLEAIAALRLMAPAQISFSPALTEPTPQFNASETTAERRPLSVMFCDLVGSTALSARLDPEDLREVIRTYQACVASTIQQFNGFIARYVGDDVLVYFGWPEAHETDAEQAARARLGGDWGHQGSAASAASGFRSASALPQGLWCSASQLARAIPASRPRSARHRTVPPGCRVWPGRVRW